MGNLNTRSCGCTCAVSSRSALLERMEVGVKLTGTCRTARGSTCMLLPPSLRSSSSMPAELLLLLLLVPVAVLLPAELPRGAALLLLLAASCRLTLTVSENGFRQLTSCWPVEGGGGQQGQSARQVKIGSVS